MIDENSRRVILDGMCHGVEVRRDITGIPRIPQPGDAVAVDGHSFVVSGYWYVMHESGNARGFNGMRVEMVAAENVGGTGSRQRYTPVIGEDRYACEGCLNDKRIMARVAKQKASQEKRVAKAALSKAS